MPLERVSSPGAPAWCTSIFMGCPSRSTPSNWLFALAAPALLSYTTSAVPVERPLQGRGIDG